MSTYQQQQQENLTKKLSAEKMLKEESVPLYPVQSSPTQVKNVSQTAIMIRSTKIKNAVHAFSVENREQLQINKLWISLIMNILKSECLRTNSTSRYQANCKDSSNQHIKPGDMSLEEEQLLVPNQAQSLYIMPLRKEAS
nr:hypothetical protein Iba_chr11dCG13890 [Ipomoea batatas]